jgi:Zn ribbon nucleic-acid-binding protein
MQKALDPELTKPTKPSSVSFVSATPGLFQELGKLAATRTLELPVEKDDARGRSSFPHCPRCASYSLYRKNNVGSYECLTCGLRDIDETSPELRSGDQMRDSSLGGRSLCLGH